MNDDDAALGMSPLRLLEHATPEDLKRVGVHAEPGEESVGLSNGSSLQSPPSGRVSARLLLLDEPESMIRGLTEVRDRPDVIERE